MKEDFCENWVNRLFHVQIVDLGKNNRKIRHHVARCKTEKDTSQIIKQVILSRLCIYHWFREYYEDQLELITSIEDILLPKTDETKDHETAYEKKHKRTIKILVWVTFIANIVCSILFLISFIHSYFLWIEDSLYHQNSRCGDINISFGHFFSCRQCGWSSNQSYSSVDSSKDQEPRCL